MCFQDTMDDAGPAACLPSSRSPYLLRQTPPRPYACSAPPDLHVPRPAACLPSSRSLEANTSTSTRFQQASRAPELHTPTSPPSARLQPVSIPPCLHASSPLHRQHASGAPYLHTSTRLRPYAGSGPLDLLLLLLLLHHHHHSQPP